MDIHGSFENLRRTGEQIKLADQTGEAFPSLTGLQAPSGIKLPQINRYKNKQYNMEHYINQLIEDLETVAKNPPQPSYIEPPPHLADDPVTAELTLVPFKTIEELTGIKQFKHRKLDNNILKIITYCAFKFSFLLYLKPH